MCRLIANSDPEEARADTSCIRTRRLARITRSMPNVLTQARKSKFIPESRGYANVRVRGTRTFQKGVANLTNGTPTQEIKPTLPVKGE